jgi:hypothetical protein
VDLEVKVGHMTKDNKNKSFHWFNLVAFEDQVSGSKLPNKYEVKLEVTNARKLLPHSQNFGLGCSKSGYNPWIIQK